MEFLRFGSSIPGSYWGCCACCIIQNFKVDPDAKASIQLVGGDGGSPITNREGKSLFAGPTYREIFWQRLRYGTHSNRDMPNHAFIAIMSRTQFNTKVGKQWLAILKEAGFEFIRSVNNSVWNVNNYIFMLVRNIGPNAVANPFAPPKEWTDLPSVVPEAYAAIPDTLALAKEQKGVQKIIWDKIGPPKFYTEDELVKLGAPIIMSGLRSKYQPEPKDVREKKMAAEGKTPTPSLRAGGGVTGIS